MKKHKNGWSQGEYNLVNPSKYVGNKPPFYRSSWEQRVMYYLDNNINVLKWGSENVIIPYLFEVDGQVHRYYIDFYAKIKDRNGNIKQYLMEVKPKKQRNQPKPPKKKTKKAMQNYKIALHTYIKNQNKWAAAVQFCKKKGLIWKILDEGNIFNG